MTAAVFNSSYRKINYRYVTLNGYNNYKQLYMRIHVY